VGEELRCSAWLDRVLALAQGKSWADRQLAVLAETGSPVEVVRHFSEMSRLEPAK
jgi:hypothetical protein